MPPTNKIWHMQHTQAQPDKTKQYICPPETNPHLATLLSFPSQRSTLPELHTKTRAEIISLATTIAAFEPVRLHTRPEDLPDAQSLLTKHALPAHHLANIKLIPSPTNHCWIRDTGPVYVRSADPADPTRYAIDFGFCEWGHKTDEHIYASRADWPVMDEPARRENSAFAGTVLDLENVDSRVVRVRTDLRLEGGGIEVDGEGTFMATESSILGARNPGLGRDEIECELRRLLGVSKFIWFPGRVGLDITDVHVDAEARFVRPGVVVVCRPGEGAEEVHWEIYREIRGVLENSTDARGRRFEVHDVVEPDLVLIKGGVPGEETVPAASYVNFYFVNGGLVMPAFGDAEADTKALELFKSLVPEREVRQVEVNALPRTGGVLHCVTQQVM